MIELPEHNLHRASINQRISCNVDDESFLERELFLLHASQDVIAVHLFNAQTNESCVGPMETNVYEITKTISMWSVQIKRRLRRSIYVA